MKSVHVPVLGHNVVLVPRHQLRKRFNASRMQFPRGVGFPTPPSSWDGSKNRAVKYPILGNNKYGDCYYADACHAAQTFTYNATGTEASFSENAVIQRYLQIAGGDNGLDDATIFKEWEGGIVGPNGPHKILDDMVIDPNDDAAIRLGLWLFCGGSWTAALPDDWINNATPGGVWDASIADQNNGHAMHLSGYDPTYLNVETWGFDPAVKLTSAGRKSADPEVTVQFSLEMFNSQGVAPHNNMTYDQLASFWHQLGGKQLPPSPFVNPPTPTPTPTPPPGPIPPLPVQYPTKAQWDAECMRLINTYHNRRAIVAAIRSVQALGDADLSASKLEELLKGDFNVC